MLSQVLVEFIMYTNLTQSIYRFWSMAGIHFEDQLASEKKCGHVGRKGCNPNRMNILKKLMLQD
jgi:isocitrate lyase